MLNNSNLFDSLIRGGLEGRTILKCGRSTTSDEGFKLTLDDGKIVEISFQGGYGQTTITDVDGDKITLV
jgi:hypothetical protein